MEMGRKMKVVWYWPSMEAGMEMELGCSRIRYTNCMEASWKPSLERHGWVVKEATYYPGRMCQQEQEVGIYMRTIYRCMV